MNSIAESVYIKDYIYHLPQDRIAEFPLDERDQSKLLVYKSGKIEQDIFRHISVQLEKDSMLVLNNTRVIEARVLFQKSTGGLIEIFCLEPAESLRVSEAMALTCKAKWHCMIGGASKWKPGQVLQKEIEIGGNKFILSAVYVSKERDSFTIEFSWSEGLVFAEVLHAAGAIPLPPYIKRKAHQKDAERYQTIFAQHQGSVAAPTAALHFTSNIFDELGNKGIDHAYVTLHVGAGTFKPVKAETIAEHQMHAEQFQVSINTLRKLKEAKRIIAVGTTSLRTLESLYWIGLKIKNQNVDSTKDLTLDQWEAYQLNSDDVSYQQSIDVIINHLEANSQEELICQTSLIIIPGYKFRSAEALITNFHQPQSTLLLLVAAFIGEDWKSVYDYALKNDFRFLSYGDSSLLWRKD